MRTGNAWTPAYTALINGLDKDAALSADQPVKIARTESALRLPKGDDAGSSQES